MSPSRVGGASAGPTMFVGRPWVTGAADAHRPRLSRGHGGCRGGGTRRGPRRMVRPRPRGRVPSRGRPVEGGLALVRLARGPTTEHVG